MGGTAAAEFTIRQFNYGDAEIVYDFFEGLSKENRYFFHPYSFTKDEAGELTSEDIAKPNTLRFMASLTIENRETMAGHVFFWDWSKKVPWLGISVRDDYQGIGLGSKLMQHAVIEAKRNGKGGILLTTAKDNLKAQSLYKKFGFETIGEDPRGELLLLLNFREEEGA